MGEHSPLLEFVVKRERGCDGRGRGEGDEGMKGSEREGDGDEWEDDGWRERERVSVGEEKSEEGLSCGRDCAKEVTWLLEATHNTPIEFHFGQQRAIYGGEEGLPLMCPPVLCT